MSILRGVTVASYLIHRLRQLGVRHLFSVPGDYACGFLDAVDRDGRIGRIGNCNEMNAGYAADAYARLSGVAAVTVTYGVGTFSLLNTVAGAFLERLPVVVVAGSPTTRERQQERATGLLYHHSVGDLNADLEVYRHVTAAAVLLDDPRHAPRQIDAALAACLAHKRPVYLEVAEDLWDRACSQPEGDLSAVPPARTGPAAIGGIEQVAALLKGRFAATTPESSGSAAAEAADEAIARLTGAAHPLIWGGIELQRFHLQDQFERLVAQTGYRFATTLSGKAILPETHPSFVGVYDGKFAPKTVRGAVARADSLLALGVWLTDEDLGGDTLDPGTLIIASHDTVQIKHHLYEPVRLEDFLRELLARFPAAAAHRPRDASTPARPSSPHVPGDHKVKLTYRTFFDRVNRFLDDSMIVLVDTGFGLFCAADLTIHRRSGFIAQAVWGSIGYTVGAALGVGCAAPAQRAVVIVGDGSFQMTCQELSTIVRHGQSPIVFVLDNGIYGVEQAAHDPKPFLLPVLPIAAYNRLARWDYYRLAEVFGGWGCAVETVGELDRALTRARERPDTMALIQVMLPQKDVPVPFVRRALASLPLPALP